ncbi:iron export ABC transporter permease subunit FetB [Rhodobacteraceae bacterium NNCM2]|nr:iron export ABC transporter permease subunit FetB [Coraliihabitans acroporae]
MTPYIALSPWDLVLASSFLVLNAVLSIALRLGLERKLIIAASRMVVQLLMVGLVLKMVIHAASPWITALVAAVMIAFAGREIWARQERRLTGLWGPSLGGGAMMLSGTLVAVFALTTQIQPAPWWSPQVSLPLFGMILGNTMTGVSLGLDALHAHVDRERRSIEAQLLLGYTRVRAMTPALRRALRTGFTPIINSMAATGVVSLPGMMTGQILAGIDPQQAVKYQLLIMFLIGGSTGLGVLTAVLASAWRLTDRRQRLRVDRLGPARP